MKRVLWMALVCQVMWLSACAAHHKGALPGEPKEATFATLSQARVHYIDTAPKSQEKPVAVLIHGFASSTGVWAGVMPALAKTHRVIALDLKGFGWSGRPRGDYSPEAQGRLVFELLEKQGVQGPVSLVAHSWGSSVAMAMALAKPAKIKRIALYDAWVYEEQLPTFFLWSRRGSLGEVMFSLFYTEQPDLKIRSAFYDPTILTQEFIEKVEEDLDRPGTVAAALAAVRGQRYELVQDQYSEIKVPVLLLWGREDAVTTLENGERLLRQLPQASIKVYPMCGHFPMLEAYQESTRDLMAFMKQDLEGTRAPKVVPARVVPAEEILKGAEASPDMVQPAQPAAGEVAE